MHLRKSFIEVNNRVLHEICVCLFTLDSRPSREHYSHNHRNFNFFTKSCRSKLEKLRVVSDIKKRQMNDTN